MSNLLVTDIAGNFGPEFAKGLYDELQREIPREKVRHYLDAEKRIREEALTIKVKPFVDGLGMRKLSTPIRTWLRWKEEDPHFWEDKKNVDNFYKDNPECRGDGR
jgi:hypothetical protein